MDRVNPKIKEYLLQPRSGKKRVFNHVLTRATTGTGTGNHGLKSGLGLGLGYRVNPLGVLERVKPRRQPSRPAACLQPQAVHLAHLSHVSHLPASNPCLSPRAPLTWLTC